MIILEYCECKFFKEQSSTKFDKGADKSEQFGSESEWQQDETDGAAYCQGSELGWCQKRWKTDQLVVFSN